MSTSDRAAEGLSPLKQAIVEIRALRQRVAELEQVASEPIALVGMGLRFPGGCDTPEQYWRLLETGGDAVGPIPAERWDVDAYYDADPDAPGRMYTRHGAFINQVDEFAPQFFSIAPREAAQMDPQQRLLLEVAWEALENAGQAPEKLEGSQSGVFLGISNSDYMRMLASDPEQIDVYLATGNASSIAAGRISYLLGLHGPSVALDTACSSSLVAVHLAVRSLRSRECDLALAGGVNLILTPEINITFSKAGMMAPDGRCKTFDASADGYVRGEGCAVVVLKRLSDALADGDRVLAVIRGTAVNQDGRSGGLTAPNGPAQEAVVRAALRDAGLAPADVGYVEAHGTGTALGDPIEVQALGAVFGPGRAAEQPLLVGSVKTNLGHLEAAAGVAGLIKLALMLEHGQVPASLHFHTPSPHIAWDELPIRVPTALAPWQAPGGRRVAGLSSFGFSGTNAHVILEAAPASSPMPGAGRQLELVALSARSETALRELAARYAAWLAEHGDASLADVAFTANSGRSHFDHRLAVVTHDVAALGQRLAAFASGNAEGSTVGYSPAGTAPEVVFLFTGHGSSYTAMGRQLYDSEPVFRAAVDSCDALLRGTLDRSMTEVLFGETGLLNQMRYAQPALFVLQYALAELWRSWGVRPSLVAGHSAGEYAAAVVAGALSLEDGLRLISTRGRLMQSLASDGEMAALFVDEARVARAIEPHAADAGIAAVNGPTTTVIAGRRGAVRAVIEALQLEPDDYRTLDVSVAAHSPLVEPILDEFERVVATVELSDPQIGLVSSLTGQLIGDELRSPRYWRRHLREPVRFAAVFDTLREAGYSAFVEIGPHPTLLKQGQRAWPDAGGAWVASLSRDTNEPAQILGGLAALYTAGASVDWDAVGRSDGRRKLALPTYPWEKKRYWTSVTTQSQPTRSAAPAWPVARAAAQQQSEQGPFDLRIETYAERWALLNRIAVASIGAALRELGLFTQPGERHRVQHLIAEGRVAPAYDHLMSRWLAHLADAGALGRKDDGSFVADKPLPEPGLAALLAQAETVFAGEQPLLDYVRRCVERMAAVVAGQESALTTLFPDGSYDTVDYLYNRWAVARYFNGIIRAAVQAVAQSRPGQQLRILEIGAGTGGTSAAVLPALPAERTSYTFTDVSDFFLARAAERFAAYPFVRYAICNIEQPPEAQGFPTQGYDLVIAANALHATRDLDATLRHVRALLAPGGTLLLYEATSHPQWFDITTGLIEGWQRFEDSWRGDNPLLTTERWAAALASAGFDDVLALPGSEQPTAVLGQHAILARAPGEARAGVAPLETGQTESRLLATPAAPAVVQPEVAVAALAGALPEERHEALVELVRGAIARVLRISDPAQLRREQPLLDLGFDSLMAVELRNVLRQALALDRKLPATLVFDYPNITALAVYLEQVALGEPSREEPVTVQVTVDAPTSAEQLAELSDEEVEAMLLKKLAEF